MSSLSSCKIRMNYFMNLKSVVIIESFSKIKIFSGVLNIVRVQHVNIVSATFFKWPK